MGMVRYSKMIHDIWSIENIKFWFIRFKNAWKVDIVFLDKMKDYKAQLMIWKKANDPFISAGLTALPATRSARPKWTACPPVLNGCFEVILKLGVGVDIRPPWLFLWRCLGGTRLVHTKWTYKNALEIGFQKCRSLTSEKCPDGSVSGLGTPSIGYDLKSENLDGVVLD